MQAKRGVFGMLAVICLMTLAGCTSGATAGRPGLPEFTPDMATWRLPVDQYLPDIYADQYASNLLYGACMRAAGAPAVVLNPTAHRSPSVNGRGRRLFTLALAQQYGYEGGPVVDIPTPPPLAQKYVATDHDCSTKAKARIGYTSDQNRVQWYGYQAATTTQHDPQVIAAVTRWRACMRPLKIKDLSTHPDEQPSASQLQRFRRLSKSRPGVASAEEIREAVFDANCQLSTGYLATSYKVECENESNYIRQDPKTFSRSFADHRRQEALAMKVLAQNGK